MQSLTTEEDGLAASSPLPSHAQKEEDKTGTFSTSLHCYIFFQLPGNGGEKCEEVKPTLSPEMSKQP